MADVTYREALRQALDEELGATDVFLMGEEIGRFEGSYKVTAGLLQKYGPARPRDADLGGGVRRRRHRRGHDGAAAGRSRS